MENIQISQSIELGVPTRTVLEFFEQLSDNPSIYKFKSHHGIFPITGNIREVGSVFETKETFTFFTLKLRFETREVDSSGSFKFKLVKPFSYFNIWGEFKVEAIGENKTKLYLIVYGGKNNFFGKILQASIFLTPVRFFIKKQTYSELVFLKEMIESEYLDLS